MELKEILVDWTVQGSPGGLSVLYFQGTEGSEVISRQQLATGIEQMTAQLCVTTTATVRPVGRIIEDTTGELVGEWSDPTPQTKTGAASIPSLPNHTQALVRWSTGVVVNGRTLKGRWFIPGLATSQLGGGELQAGAVAALTSAANTVQGSSGLRVWSRPFAGDLAATPPRPARAGSSALVNGASVWSELAVLTNRR